MAKRAKGILVSLGIVKAGFLVGAQYGSGGALFKNGRTAGYYNIIAGSYGLQAGVGPSVVVVDKGVAKSLTTTTAKSGEHAFIFGQKGLIAGLGLQGSKISHIYLD